MRTLIVLVVLGSSLAAPFLQDTPEVVAERARFIQLYNAQAAAAAAAPDDPVPTVQQPHVVSTFSAAPTFHHATPVGSVWTGPIAATIPAGLPGSGTQVSDTPEVSQAREAFLAAYRAQVAATTGRVTPVTIVAQPSHVNVIPAAPLKWTGPLAATIPAGVDGRITPVSDTADVVAAKAAFQAAYNAALSSTRPVAAQAFVVPSQPIAIQQPRWVGPVSATIPAGLPGSVSQVPETADVAAATAAFQRAYQAAVAATTGRRF